MKLYVHCEISETIEMTFKIETYQTKLDTWHINCRLKKIWKKFFKQKKISEKNLKTIFQVFFKKKIEKLKKKFWGEIFFFLKKKIVERKWKKILQKFFSKKNFFFFSKKKFKKSFWKKKL